MSSDPDDLEDLVATTMTAATSEAPHHAELEAFIKSEVGGEFTVLHEIASDFVHLDVLVFPPNAKSPHWTFVTTGMSDRPMPNDEQDVPERFRYAELVLRLPATWFSVGGDGYMPHDELDDKAKFWPIGVLKFVARAPHQYGFWLGRYHSLPNGDPAEPYAPLVPFVGVMLRSVEGWTGAESPVRLADRHVTFLALDFLTAKEMDYKLRHDGEKLERALRKSGISQVLDIGRKSARLGFLS